MAIAMMSISDSHGFGLSGAPKGGVFVRGSLIVGS